MAERNEMMQQNQKQNIEQKYYYTVMEEQEGMRLDQFLAGELKEHSRSYIQKLIKEGRVTVGDKKEKPGCRLKVEDNVVICVPPLKELEVLPEKMDLDIIYEDEDVILINKPKDMVVHPCPGRYTGTLVNGLLYHCRDNLSGINGVLRPGIVHRIDKDTTGVLVVCKNDMAHKSLAEQLKEHSITRKYEAIVYNNFTQEEGTVDAPIGRSPADRKKMAVEPKNGKRAVTHYKVLSHLNHQFNHIECQLETGRTHQIRVHMASIRHPLLGDTTYGPKNAMGLTGQLAEQLKEHSITRKYEAIVYNNFTQEEGTVDAPIGRSPADRKKMAVEPKNGKRAVTHYKVLSHLNHQFNHIECQLETGRTHQIRVHMASIRHPLLGDTTYGPKNAMGLTGQCLHARVLGFIHPRTGEYVEFEAPLPEYFQKLLEKYS